MLDVPALLTLATLVLVYGCYAVGWLFWHLFKNKGGKSVADSETVLFSGGPKPVRNVVFLGIAASQLFTPCMANEQIIWPGLNMVVMLISRVVAFLLCMFYWNHLAALRFRNVEEYLLKRFDSKLILFLTLLNRVMGLYYIWYVYMRTYDQFRLFNVKSLVSFVHITCAFSTLASLGGMNVVLMGCVLLWLVSTSGEILLMHKTFPYMFRNSSLLSLKVDPCYSLYGPNCLLMIFGQFLTVQPIFNVFQAANSVWEANIAMCIGLFLAVINTLVTMCYTNGLLTYALREGVEPYNAVHTMFGYIFKRAELFVPRFPSKSQLEKAYEQVLIPYKHFFVLLGPYVSNTIAFYLLQMQALSMHTYLHILPNWLRAGLVTDGRELHMTFTALFILTAYLTIVLLIYSVSATATEHAVRFYHLFQPFVSGMLIIPVTCYVVLGPICSDLWSIPAVVVSVTATFAGVIFATQSVNSLQQTCTAHWFPTVLFLLTFLGNLIMAAVLRPPRFITPSLLFKYHLKLRRKNEKTRTTSILSLAVGQRTGRSSFRLGMA
ncbi:unnamed protein product [Echinostoma caproni]|uniref:Conserved plasma membrane protein n=1 Tax=Echinostoma caproni TaxID=27848 RepID=A0A183A5Y1_9TREM|nr:unnamed protein product [Echinostoma caproni]